MNYEFSMILLMPARLILLSKVTPTRPDGYRRIHVLDNIKYASNVDFNTRLNRSNVQTSLFTSAVLLLYSHAFS